MHTKDDASTESESAAIPKFWKLIGDEPLI